MSQSEYPEELINYFDFICKAIRETVEEYGKDSLKGAVIIDEVDLLNHEHEIGGVKYLYCPTITGPTLGNVGYKIARFFEDTYEGYIY
jgi:hypothetical protein